MADLATLSVGFDPTALNKGREALEVVGTAAKKASTATDNLGRSADAAGQRMAGISRASEMNAKALQKAERAAAAVDKEMRTISGGMSQATISMMKMDKAADAVSASLDRARDATGRFLKSANDAAVQARILGGAAGGAGAGLGGLGDGLGRAGKQAEGANKNIKLTSGQVQNLGYQINDIGTMLAVGASPFQVIASQGGQIVQALGDGPGGVSGSLKAIGSSILGLATRTNLMIAGLTAAAGAAIYFGVQGAQKIKPLNEAVDEHAKALRDVAASYGIALKARDKYDSSPLTSLTARRSADELRLSARSSLLNSGFAGGGDMLRARRTDEGGRTYEAYEKFKAVEGPLVKLAQGLRSGTADARKFVDEIAAIAGQDPANDVLQKMVQGLVDLARPAADAAEQLDLLGDSMARMQQIRASDAGSRFSSFLPDTTTDREKIQRAYAERMSAIGQLPSSSRGTAESMQLAAVNDLRKALGDLDRQEADRRAGAALDLQAITVRTAAEKAEIDAQRERLSLSGQDLSESEKAQRIEQARSLSLAQSSHDTSEALRQRSEATRDAVVDLQLELKTVGMSTSAAAALRFEYQAVTEAKRAAAEAGMIVSDKELAYIKEAAGRVGEFTAAIEAAEKQKAKSKALKETYSDLAFERQQIGRTPVEQDVYQKLRTLGVAYDSLDGQKIAGEVRYNEALQKTQNQLEASRDMARDFAETLVGGLQSGESALKSVTNAFAAVGAPLSADGADELFQETQP